MLIFGAGLLVLLPAVLMGGNLSLDGIWGVGGVISVSGPELLLAWGAGLLFLLFGAHAASVVVRSRSSWAVLDLAALVAVAGLFWAMVRRMVLEGVLLRLSLARQEERLGIVAWMELGFFAAALLSLMAASALQVTRGRTDLQAVRTGCSRRASGGCRASPRSSSRASPSGCWRRGLKTCGESSGSAPPRRAPGSPSADPRRGAPATAPASSTT